LGLYAALALTLRLLHPDPGPPFRWLAAAFLAAPAAAWAHGLTLLTMEITWRGIRYKVKWKGVVDERGGRSSSFEKEEC
jgi:hypothetical protein